VPLPNETDLCRLMLATDHARADKARLALVVGGCRVMGARLVLALLCRARVVKLEERRPPQAGEYVSHWGAVGRVRVEGFCTVEVRARPKACSVDGARAESTQPARAALLWQAAMIKSCLRQKNFVFSMKYALGAMTRRT